MEKTKKKAAKATNKAKSMKKQTLKNKKAAKATPKREAKYPERAKLIDTALKLSGLKMQFIAEKLGVTRVTLTNWRKGYTTPKPSDYKRLVDLLELHG